MELAATIGLWWTPVLALIVVFRALGLSGLRPAWLAIAILVYAIYVVANMEGDRLIPLEEWVGDLEWNWAGKLAAILSTVAVFIVLALTTKAVTRQSAGLTLRQAPGSVTPALVMLAVLVASAIALEILAADGQSLGAERLAYQAAMPGIDEELFYRGVFLAVLTAAVPSGRVNLLGARIGFAGLLVTLLFGLGQGHGGHGRVDARPAFADCPGNQSFG